MTRPEHDPGIEFEPHLNAGHSHTPDPSESKAEQTIERDARRGGAERLAAMHAVTEEPFVLKPTDEAKKFSAGSFCAQCGYDMRGCAHAACPECGFDPSGGFGPYLKQRIEQTPSGTQWLVFLIALATGGILSVLGSLFGQLILDSDVGLVAYAVTTPIYEEFMKVIFILMLIELRPWVFKHAWAIWVAAIGSAATFATLENLLYLNVYIPNPTPGIILWRWTVCSALHLGCTTTVTFGLIRMWRSSITRLRPPAVSDAYPFIVAAIVVHGTYNGIVLLAEVFGLSF